MVSALGIIEMVGEEIMDGAVQQKRKNKALVVTSRNVHYTIVRPVIEELQRRDWKVTILHFERIWEMVESMRARIRKRSLESFYMETSKTRAKKINWYVYNFIAKFISVLMKVFKIEKPNIILVLTDGPPPCKIAVLAGRFTDIPSLLLLHVGMIGRNYECPKFLVDKIAVAGEFAEDILIKCGVDKERLVVTGRPTYDALVRAEERFEKDEICRRLGLDPTRRTIVYTTENLPQSESEGMVYAVCKAVKELSGLQFVVKVHPSELDLSMYQRVTRDIGVEALITRDLNIYEVLYVSDVVITGFSATALDAMMLDKLVITVNFTGLEDPLPFAESGAAIGVYEEKDLVQAIKTGLYEEDARERLGKAREKFVYDHSYKKDGKSTERVIKLIEQMTED